MASRTVTIRVSAVCFGILLPPAFAQVAAPPLASAAIESRAEPRPLPRLVDAPWLSFSHFAFQQAPQAGPPQRLKDLLRELDKLLDEAIDHGLNASQWYDGVIKSLIKLKYAAIAELGAPSIYGHTFAGWYDLFEEIDNELNAANATNDGANFDGVRTHLKKARDAKKKLEGWLLDAGAAPPQRLKDLLKRMDAILDEAIDHGLNASQWYDEIIKDLIRLKLAAIGDFGAPPIYGHTFGGLYDLFEEIDNFLNSANGKNDGGNFGGLRDELKKARDAKKKLEGWILAAANVDGATKTVKSIAGTPDDFKSESGHALVPGRFRLPQGSLFATATVVPETQVEIRQPGNALVATAEVVEVRRVQPGDRIRAGDLSSVQFDDGTGLIVDSRPSSAMLVPLAVTAGIALLNDPHRPSGLPVFNGSSTVCATSKSPFSSLALVAKSSSLAPSATQAVFLNPAGERVGQMATFGGLKASDCARASIRTLDAAGATTHEARLGAVALDGTPTVSFDRPVYSAGQGGQLKILNQDNYAKVLDATRFGGCSDIGGSPVYVSGSENAQGLASQAPFGTASLPFTALRPGAISVGVVMPKMIPPQPPGQGADSPSAKEAAKAYSNWQRLFHPAKQGRSAGFRSASKERAKRRSDA